MPDGHRTAELPLDELLALARGRVERWIEDGGPVPAESALRWRSILAEPRLTLAGLLTADTQEMRDLRQNTPFAGALPARERWRVRSEIP